MAQVIPAPKYKKDWPGEFLLLHEPYLRGNVTAPVVRIMRRKNAMDTMHNARDVSGWGSVRVLEVGWSCAHCGAHHSGYLPESLIEEGKADFVKLEKR